MTRTIEISSNIRSVEDADDESPSITVCVSTREISIATLHGTTSFPIHDLSAINAEIDKALALIRQGEAA